MNPGSKRLRPTLPQLKQSGEVKVEMNMAEQPPCLHALEDRRSLPRSRLSVKVCILKPIRGGCAHFRKNNNDDNDNDNDNDDNGRSSSSGDTCCCNSWSDYADAAPASGEALTTMMTTMTRMTNDS